MERYGEPVRAALRREQLERDLDERGHDVPRLWVAEFDARVRAHSYTLRRFDVPSHAQHGLSAKRPLGI